MKLRSGSLNRIDSKFRIVNSNVLESTYITIVLKNIEHNYYEMKACLKDKLFAPTIKANAYGHGALMVGALFESLGVPFLSVARMYEVYELKEAGIKTPLILFGVESQVLIGEIVRAGIHPVIGDLQLLLALNNEAKRQKIVVKVHLKFDLGMSRIGFPLQEQTLSKLSDTLKNCSYLSVEGICSHLPEISPSDVPLIQKKSDTLTWVVKELSLMGIEAEYVHLGNSFTSLAYPQLVGNLIRPGLSLYGYPKNNGKKLPLKPAWSLTSKVVALRSLKKGENVSYGASPVRQDSDIATVAIGYGDGLSRAYSPHLKVSIRGKLYPIEGLVTMDFIMVNLGKGHSIVLGDEVVILGSAPGAMSLEDFCVKSHLIPYEVLCRFDKMRVPKIYR